MYVSLNELRHRVKILRPITEEDGAGNLIRTDEEEVAVVWAKVLSYAAKISDGYMEKVDEVKYRIVIRWRDDVEVTDEIAWRSHRFIQTAPAYDLRSNSISSWMSGRMWKMDTKCGYGGNSLPSSTGTRGKCPSTISSLPMWI